MSAPARTRRCFIALPVDDLFVADVRDAMHGIEIDGLRRVRESNLHVTVKFLGDVEEPRIERVIAAMRASAAGTGPIELEAAGMSYLPDARRARVLAVDFEPSGSLSALVERLEDALAAVGFRREGRAYRPHVTVGRFVRPPRHTPRARSITLGPTGFTADRMTLMESILSPGAAEYVEMASVELS